MANSVTNDKLYEVLNSLRSEIKSDMQTLKVDIGKQLEPIQTDIAEIKKMYVLKAEFTPVKQLAYGMVGIILASIIAYIVQMVLK